MLVRPAATSQSTFALPRALREGRCERACNGFTTHNTNMCVIKSHVHTHDTSKAFFKRTQEAFFKKAFLVRLFQRTPGRLELPGVASGFLATRLPSCPFHCGPQNLLATLAKVAPFLTGPLRFLKYILNFVNNMCESASIRCTTGTRQSVTKNH
jgi:hypothetical protein